MQPRFGARPRSSNPRENRGIGGGSGGSSGSGGGGLGGGGIGGGGGRAGEYKIVVLGAGGVGKSCLTAQFVQNTWIEHYDPTIEDTYRKQLEVDGRQCVLEILDTAGTEQFTAMRELYLTTGHGFLLVFSITSLASLLELSELREQIIRIKDDARAPLVLVGNKSDLEEDRAVARARAFAVSQSWGNAPYYETSARRRTNVDEVFRDLCRQIIRRDPAMLGRAGGSGGYRERDARRTGGSGGGRYQYGGGGQVGRSALTRPGRKGGGGGGGSGGGGGGGGRRTRRDERICTIL
jgi:small GTP-binding protein